MQDNKIVVVGSMNMDHVINCRRLPRPGETIAGQKFSTHPGGKGANQAAAAGQLGGTPLFIGARGDDDTGLNLQDHLQNMGVNTDLKFSEENTGTAHIFVTDDGENHIVIIAGANDTLSPEDIRDKKDSLERAEVVLLQLEIPLETVVETARLAAEAGSEVLLDPAPARELPVELLENVDYLLPNSQELSQLAPDMAGEDADDLERIRHLQKQGVRNVLLTRGEEGALLVGENERYEIEALEVETVDTTAAGDAFAGAFALGLAGGLSPRDAAELGAAYGSAAVTSAGAQSSLLTRQEFIRFAPDAGRLLP